MSRRSVIILVLVIVLIIGGIAYGMASRQPDGPETAQPERRTITQEIEFTGHLQAKQTAKLGFESSGVATAVNAEVGDVVQSGQRLATLDTSLGQLEVASARASRLSAAATTQTALLAAESAQTATAAQNIQTVEGVRQSVRNAKRELDQANEIWQQTVRESGDESSLTKAKYSVVVSAENAYKAAQTALKETEKAAAKSNDAAAAAVESARVAHLNTQQASAAVAGTSALAAAEQMAGVRLAKHTLTAPFLGVVTEKSVVVGEVAVAGQPVLTIQTVDDAEITAQVTETDITKLRTGLLADVTLEAYDANKIWQTTVTAIDPAAVTIEGVPTYKVTLRFATSDPQLRPGLTANVRVKTAEKENALTIPRRAVRTNQNRSYVLLHKPGGTTEERTIVTGLAGTDGTIEILEGLSEQDAVVIREAT